MEVTDGRLDRDRHHSTEPADLSDEWSLLCNTADHFAVRGMPRPRPSLFTQDRTTALLDNWGHGLRPIEDSL
jgi:hypothetical protein